MPSGIPEKKVLRRLPSKVVYGNAIRFLNKELKAAGEKKQFLRVEVHIAYKKWNGRCAYCGYSLSVINKTATNALFFQLYIPLNRGGEATIENLVPVCRNDYTRYKPVRKLRETIPDIDTIADIIEVLIKTRLELHLKQGDANLLLEKLARVKRVLNNELENVVLNLKYKPFKDWNPENFEIMIEDDNSIPDLIDNTTKDIARQADENVIHLDKKEITEKVKQTVASQQYRIVRNPKA